MTMTRTKADSHAPKVANHLPIQKPFWTKRFSLRRALTLSLARTARETNLIEAVHFLSTGKSFRTGRAAELVRIGDKAGSVFGLVSSDVGEYTIGLALEDGEKQPFYNGNEVRNISDFFGKLICISFTPTDIDLVKGGPQERRRFIDKHAVDLRPGILSHHMQYSRALRNKNALLKFRRTFRS